MAKHKPLSIEIESTFETTDDLVDALKEISSLVNQGFTSGYDPRWSLSGEGLDLAAGNAKSCLDCSTLNQLDAISCKECSSEKFVDQYNDPVGIK